jgi:hypothetical protein
MREGWEGSSGQVLRDAGGRLGISLVFMLPEKGTPSEIERVFAAMEQQRPDAALVSGEGDLYANRQLIAELAQKKRLPTMCHHGSPPQRIVSEQANHFETKHAKTFATKFANNGLLQCSKSSRRYLRSRVFNEVSATQSFQAGGAYLPVWYQSHRSLRRSPSPYRRPWHGP